VHVGRVVHLEGVGCCSEAARLHVPAAEAVVLVDGEAEPVKQRLRQRHLRVAHRKRYPDPKGIARLFAAFFTPAGSF
jgi:hypothetical protein